MTSTENVFRQYHETLKRKAHEWSDMYIHGEDAWGQTRKGWVHTKREAYIWMLDNCITTATLVSFDGQSVSEWMLTQDAQLVYEEDENE